MKYTVEKNFQMIIYLLKERGINRIIASPGTMNVPFVVSVQKDPFFTVFSCVDERSAAYMACGMAAESGEPVVITCTGATASRNYMPGLTEAYYRGLPILVVTGSDLLSRIGHNIPQLIDRTTTPNDVVISSYQIPIVTDTNTSWEAEVKINSAFNDLLSDQTGPVHLNVVTSGWNPTLTDELIKCRSILRIDNTDNFPPIKVSKIAIFVGNHSKWSEELTCAVDEFCEKYNAVVWHDHTSKYHGKYGILYNLISYQEMYDSSTKNVDLLIHIGNVSGSYMSFSPKEVWRVSSNGKVVDTFRKLTNVFACEELVFFKQYNNKTTNVGELNFYAECKDERDKILKKIDKIPFSNLYVARALSKRIPDNSVLHLAILNTLRCWNFFDVNKNVDIYCNTGGFGIDGIMSTLIGASLINPDRQYYGVIGDLAFFYDINSLANRYVGKNLHILVINNGKGTEFRNYNHMAAAYGSEADKFIAAAGHFGNKSHTLLKHYAEDLGLEYICANNEDEFDLNVGRFIQENEEKSVVFEVFTESDDESIALKIINNLEVSTDKALKSAMKHTIKKMIGRG